MKKFFGGLVLFLSFLVIWPGTPVDAADSKTIASGVYIGSLDVSGMSVDEAEQAVHCRSCKSLPRARGYRQFSSACVRQ